MNESGIQSGFKPSPLGPIPNDWEINELDEVFEFINTLSFSRENLTNAKTKNEIYYIHYGDIHATFKSEVLDFDIEKRVPYLKDEFCRNNFNFLQEGDLVIADASEDYTGIGESIEIKNIKGKKVIGGLHTIVIRDKAVKTINGYRTYIFRNFKVHNEIKKLATGISVYSISKGNLSKLGLPIPPLNEQNSIANCLATWDRSISVTTAIIFQKELRKRWLIKQLLTGKKRLIGYKEPWQEVRIGDVTINFSRRNKDLVNAKVYSVTNTNGFVLQSEHFERDIAGEDLSNYKIIKKNEFAYNPARINVGSIAYFTEEFGVISSLYVCFSTKTELLDYYLLQFLQLEHTKHRIGSLGEGGVRIYLWYDLFSKLRIKLPSIEEQTAIARVLQSADKGITLLKDKLAKFKEQKKGLMQVLLTGKKRFT
ncbi:MAG: restriction endonuclease subunit S [Bacteroidales bacterium]|jgi:type I restriction enzyme S subunit|nr:restriction endonuclease subunit S [Bacteroidales bacterium]